VSTETYVIRECLRRNGGKWLAMARTWMQSNIRRGDTMTWGDTTLVQVPFCELERLALEAAVGATVEANEVKEGPGTAPFRFNRLLKELEKRFPHPNPFDSTKATEQYMLEAIDKLIAQHDANRPNQGWQMWNGTGKHPTGDTKVAYRMLDGDTQGEDFPGRAGDLDWARTDKREDWEIAAYKVIE
jgi:hypothetical protein